MNRGIVHFLWTNAAQSLSNVTFRLTQSEAITAQSESLVYSRRILHITGNLPPMVEGLEPLNWRMAGQLPCGKQSIRNGRDAH